VWGWVLNFKKRTLLDLLGNKLSSLDVRLFSDIHLELEYSFRIPNLKENQVIILAGDIGSQSRSKTLNIDIENFLIDTLKYGSIVIYVAGNHEFWGSRIDKFHRLIREFERKNSNFYFLDNESLFINDIEFIGSTLWTDFNNEDPLTYLEIGGSKSYGRTANTSNDYRKIKYKDNNQYRKINTLDTLKLHKQAIRYIKSRINQKHTQFVISHYAPSEIFLDKDRYSEERKNGYKHEITKYAYYSELEELAENFQFWAAGHTHFYVNITKNGVRYLSNPRGYANVDKYRVALFNPNLIIQVLNGA